MSERTGCAIEPVCLIKLEGGTDRVETMRAEPDGALSSSCRGRSSVRCISVACLRRVQQFVLRSFYLARDSRLPSDQSIFRLDLGVPPSSSAIGPS